MKTVAIIAPMELEFLPVRGFLTNVREKTVAGTRWTEGTLAGVEVLLYECSVGKVNAALHTQLLIERVRPDAILNVGVAGSLTPLARHCTPVVVTACRYHDMRPGTLQKFPPYTNRFESDSLWCRLLREAAGAEALAGLDVTGDRFISSLAEKQALLAQDAPLCVEMECAAIAQTAFVNGVPFAALRCISDLADDSAQADCDSFEHQAAQRAAEIVVQAVRRFGEEHV